MKMNFEKTLIFKDGIRKLPLLILIHVMFQLKSALEKHLSELEKLSEAIKRERQIIQDLNEIEPKING